jgi:hypothetical protein
MLFRGASFDKAWDFAVGSGNPRFVRSAKFGILDPDEVIAP